MGRKLIDLTGKKFSNLIVLKIDKEKSCNRKHYWICKCDCGNLKSIDGSLLKRGAIKGCGCLRKGHPKYEIQNKKIYKKWSHMKSRCYNKKDISYKNYGGRGIKVCKEWLDYNNFAKWCLENGFQDNLELDRIDTNKDYMPSNCRFITHLENSRNKRKSLVYEYNNKKMTLKEIAEENNIKYKTLWQRIKRDKKTIEEAIKEL